MNFFGYFKVFSKYIPCLKEVTQKQFYKVTFRKQGKVNINFFGVDRFCTQVPNQNKQIDRQAC